MSLGIPVVAPAFSTWLDASPYEHMAQSVRSLVMATQLSLYNAVVPSIPLSPWVRPAMWGSALGGAPDVAIDFGTIGVAGWRRYVDGILAALASELHPVPRLIAYGVLSPRRLENVTSAWPGKVVFVSRGPVDHALNGDRLSYPDLIPSKDWDQERQELVKPNDMVFRAVVEGLLGRTMTSDLKS
ncbi:MAG: hypothetical protein WED83_08600 [Acidimicrobiia bacterium]